MVGGTLLHPQTVLLVTWEATLKPYKHQITHLGRVDIVISAKKNLFLKIPAWKRGKPDGRAQTYPTYPGIRPAQAKRIYTCRAL